LSPRNLEAEVDEACDPEDVQHGECSEEKPRQDEEDQLTPFLDRGFVESWKPFELVLLGR
jgi:hypothetical protein